MSLSDTAIEISSLKFGWKKHHPILSINELNIQRNARTFLKGESGSGKSTLLGLIAGILTPDSGYLKVFDTEVSSLSSAKRDQFRSEHMGIIFQMFNLLPFLSIEENVSLPCRFSKVRKSNCHKNHGSVEAEAKELLNKLGLDPKHFWERKVFDLSVGQQQRVAAARALIGSPSIIIADEPTSALDTKNRNSFIELLSQSASTSETTLLFVSHDETLASEFDFTIDIDNINLAAEGLNQ